MVVREHDEISSLPTQHTLAGWKPQPPKVAVVLEEAVMLRTPLGSRQVASPLRRRRAERPCHSLKKERVPSPAAKLRKLNPPPPTNKKRHNTGAQSRGPLSHHAAGYSGSSDCFSVPGGFRV